MNGSSTWISVADTAILLKVRPATIIRQIEKGTLPARTPEEMPFTYDGKPNFEVAQFILPLRRNTGVIFVRRDSEEFVAIKPPLTLAEKEKEPQHIVVPNFNRHNIFYCEDFIALFFR